MAHLDATYHFGFPAASYVYHAAKTTSRRWVKSNPQPDSLAFHHRPLNAPGALAAATGGESGGVHTVGPGTVAMHWTFEALNASAPVWPTPRQKVPPAMAPAAELSRMLTAWFSLEATLPTKLSVEPDAPWRPDGP